MTKNLQPQFFPLLQRLPGRDCRINVEVWMQVFDSKSFLTSPTLLKWFHGIQICQRIDSTSTLAYKSPSNVWKEMGVPSLLIIHHKVCDAIPPKNVTYTLEKVADMESY